MFEATEKAFGGIDALVNNAGIMMLAKVADSDDAMLDRQIAVNLKGTFYGMREAARRMRNGGEIVNFSTSVVGTKLETYSVYAATKAAVETMTAILSKELRGRNITVNAVAPGPVTTELFLEGKSPELVERMAKMNPMERLGTPEDIASVVSFLLGPDGGWVNGQVLRANGGWCKILGFSVRAIQDRRIHLARIAMAEIVDFTIGDVGAGRRQHVAGYPCRLHRKHPVERAVHDVDRQAA